MPTTNPVPSTDPSDLLFNAGKLDEVVNGTANSFTDRLGVSRRTVAGMNADFDAQLADAESDLNVYRADAAASAAEALGYLQTIRATSYGAYASDPATDPLGNPPTIGDEYFNTTANLLKRWNGTTWQASDINTANLAASSGSSLVGYDGGTVQDVLDGAKSLQNYAALRAYNGRATRIYITGLLVTAKPAGIAGVFQYDPTDTTSADNGGTIIVGADGRRWKRDFIGAVNIKWFGAKGDWNGVTGTDDTAAIQAALNSLPTMTYSDPVQTYTNGGGEIFAPRGSYLVTDTLLFSGSILFRGEAMLSTYIRFRPSSPKHLFKGNTSKYSRGTSWGYVEFSDLFLGGDLFTTQNAQTAFDFEKVYNWKLTRCVVEQFTRGLYKSGEGYYHVIDSCYFYNNKEHIYDNAGSNPTTVLGGVFWNYGPSWPADRKPDYLIYTKGMISFQGTAIEPGNSANNASTFVCIYMDGRSPAVSLNGCYSESIYPLLSYDCDAVYYSKSTINMVHPYVSPLVRLRNFKSPSLENASFDYLAVQQSIDLGMSPSRLPVFRNGSFNKGAYSWVINNGTNYTSALDTTEKFLNKVGVYTTTFTDRAPFTRVTCAARSVPLADSAPYAGQVVSFSVLLKLSENVTDFRWQVSLTGSSPLSYKFASSDRAAIDYGNGWKLYVVSIKLDPSNAFQPLCEVLANVASGTSGTVKVAGMFAHVGGWEMFPYDRWDSDIYDTAAPTTGTWTAADKIWNSSPAAGGAPGWVCVAAGSPGTWKAMAALAA